MTATLSLASCVLLIVGGLAFAVTALQAIPPAHAQGKQLEALMVAEGSRFAPAAKTATAEPTAQRTVRKRTRFPQFVRDMLGERAR